MKTFFKIILIVVFFLVLYLNFSLYYQPNFAIKNGQQYNEDVYHQLHFLKHQLENGADYDMQDIFPEGYVFLHALYCLTWCNLIENLDKKSQLYLEGMVEISKSLKAINSPIGKSTFSKDTPLEYGAFYRGWSNFLLGYKLLIQTEKIPKEVKLFKQNCNEILIALQQSESPFLETYAGKTWPADGVIAIASLNLHDKIFTPVYQESIELWIEKIKEKLDPETGLIPHSVNIEGMTTEGARGSSQSLILLFLKDIDEEFAKQQFETYTRIFLDFRLGLPGIREYPKGQNGKGDIDSGPVIWGVGGAASVVGQGTMAKYKNWSIYEGLRNCIRGFGVAYTYDAKRKYIFGQLPIADAFIAWSNSSENEKKQVKNTSNWRFQFQLLSLITMLLIGLIFSRLKSK